MASPPPTGGQLISNMIVKNNKHVKKCGYLRKQKHGHKRFFVLREASEGSPARLEYYESEKKWKNKSAAKRVIPLDYCLNINKRADAKNKHLIALYTKDEYFAVAAENEQEQEDWYEVLTDLMNEGKVSDGSASNSASSLVGFDEANYGVITPVSATYKEVWQVNLKSKGLGQSRNLTGVCRLCLSSRTISFVKLNTEVASVVLQLMNIRRCGHSDSFFFIEVGRSASIGPGELWMQADDSVVAQNIHETILEAMKAMKEMSEFRPRSKSQSSGTNPISVPTRRHFNNLPPSQTGLPRRSRTDSMAATSPVTKLTSCRIRTASEGDGTMTRPMSVTGSPISTGVNRTHLSRSNTVTARPCRTFETSSLQHSKSMCMPVSHSPPSAASPASLSCSSGCNLESTPRPSSCTASISGSPIDAGFISCDECGSSPGDMRHLATANRSNTPESLTGTPPFQEGSDLHGYMIMERANCIARRGARAAAEESLGDLEKAYRKRTHSLTMPYQKRVPSQVSSASLDEYTLMRATYTTGGHSGRSSHTASPKVTYPEDYGDIQIGSLLKSSSSNLGDDGYMPMTPGVAPQGGKADNYMPMSPMCVSAPKQIINPRTHPLTIANGYRTNSPSSCSLDDSGYMRMLCGSKFSVDSSDGKMTNGEYLNMSPVDCGSVTPPDYYLSPVGVEPSPCLRQLHSFNSLPRCYKPQQKDKENDQYVVMNPQSNRIIEKTVTTASPPVPSPLRQGRTDSLVHRHRISRPTRLSLDTIRTLPSMNEHPLPSEPKSPGEYINIDFGRIAESCSPPSTASSESPASSLGSSGGQRQSPLSDYMNIEVSSQSLRSGDVAPSNALETLPELTSCPAHPEEEEEEKRYHLTVQVASVGLAGKAKDDYTEMTFGVPASPPQPVSQPTEGGQTTSPSSCMQRLTLDESVGVPAVEAFLLRRTTLALVDPDRGAKVIRADPQGRRRHSSETFSSTTTVTPVFPSFVQDTRRHGSASVENVSVSVRNSEGSDEEYNSPMCRETSAGFQNGLNYIALNLMDGGLASCDSLVRFKTASCCKEGINGIHASPYASLGFKETATTVKGKLQCGRFNVIAEGGD